MLLQSLAVTVSISSYSAGFVERVRDFTGGQQIAVSTAGARAAKTQATSLRIKFDTATGFCVKAKSLRRARKEIQHAVIRANSRQI